MVGFYGCELYHTVKKPLSFTFFRVSMMDFHNSIQSYPSFDWDLHSFGVLNSDMSALMQSSSLLSADSSSGYLEDAVFQWNDHCKRRRVLLISQEQMSSPCSETNLQDSWRSASEEDLYLNFSWPIGDDEFTMVSDDPFSFSTSINTQSSGATPSTETRTKTHEHLSSPSSSSDKEPAVQIAPANDCRDSSSPSSLHNSPEGCRRRRKKAAGLTVAYPFAMVKPGGIEGDVTLGDINERIHMRPTRPIRHPVGEFACVPCVSPGGPGLSGKDVVALNRIHTKGNGTITIIRTRG